METRKYTATGTGGMSPSPALLFRAQKENEALRASGRYAGGGESFAPYAEVLGIGVGWEARREFVRKRKEDGSPTNLPQVAARGVDAGRLGERVLPLPVDAKTLHARQRGAAGSVVKEKAASWLSSVAGQEWKQDRASLFQHEGEGGVPPPGR